jgi:hypothetical protein
MDRRAGRRMGGHRDPPDGRGVDRRPPRHYVRPCSRRSCGRSDAVSGKETGDGARHGLRDNTHGALLARGPDVPRRATHSGTFPSDVDHAVNDRDRASNCFKSFAQFGCPSNRPLQILAGCFAVCPRHPHGHHVGEVDHHTGLAGLAVVSRVGQNQAAPFVERGRSFQAPRLRRRSRRLSGRRPRRPPGGIA